jgi:hypothetical protein
VGSPRTDQPPVLDEAGVVAVQRAAEEERQRLGHRRGELLPGNLQAADRRVADTGCGQRRALTPHADCGHLAGRERAGLVGADDGRRAQRLDRAQPLDERALGRHALHPSRQRYRHHRRQALGHESDHHAERVQEGVDERRAGEQPEPQQQRAQGDGHDRDAPRGDGDLALQRAGLILNRAREPVDMPELGR